MEVSITGWSGGNGSAADLMVLPVLVGRTTLPPEDAQPAAIRMIASISSKARGESREA